MERHNELSKHSQAAGFPPPKHRSLARASRPFIGDPKSVRPTSSRCAQYQSVGQSSYEFTVPCILRRLHYGHVQLPARARQLAFYHIYHIPYIPHPLHINSFSRAASGLFMPIPLATSIKKCLANLIQN